MAAFEWKKIDSTASETLFSNASGYGRFFQPPKELLEANVIAGQVVAGETLLHEKDGNIYQSCFKTLGLEQISPSISRMQRGGEE